VLFVRKYTVVEALHDITFTINEGEIVGYIGPNGAGKSTTIKVMSGILAPDNSFSFRFSLLQDCTLCLRGSGKYRAGVFMKCRFLLGVIHIAFSLTECFARGLDAFSSLVSAGESDRLLVHPRNTIFTGIFILAATMCFWTIQGLEVANIFTDGGREMAQYPLNIYQKWVPVFFTFIIPFGCVNYLPLLYILDKVNGPIIFYMLTSTCWLAFFLPLSACLASWCSALSVYWIIKE
jgi:ABC-2 type transport system permease protein